MFYRITDWSKIYENNRTREMKHMAWVPVPNRMDGEGYTELVNHPNGAAHLGAWLAILEIASRCDERGTLLRGNGRPHDAASFSTVSRLPVEIFKEVIPRLLDIGWMSVEVEKQSTCTIPQLPAEKPQANAEIPQVGDQERKERKNGKNRTEATAPKAKWEIDEQITQDIREALLRFVADIPGWNLPPPDDALCQRIAAIVDTHDQLPLIGHVLADLHKRHKRPAESWGWFPEVIEAWLKPPRAGLSAVQ